MTKARSFPQIYLEVQEPLLRVEKALLEVKDSAPQDQLDNLEEQIGGACREIKMVVSGLTLTHSAVVVFAHSIVDDIATQACWLIAEADPEAWDIDNKTVPLSDLRSKTSEQVRRSVLDKHVESLGREPLEKRISAVLTKCPDQPRQLILDGLPYKFDMGELRRLDKFRQDIIHRVVIDKGSVNREFLQLIVFSCQTCLFLLDTVAARFGIDRT